MKMFLVVGGTTGSALTYTDSTEILDPELGSWRAAAALPITMSSVRAANIDGRVLIFGISTYIQLEDSYKRVKIFICTHRWL